MIFFQTIPPPHPAKKKSRHWLTDPWSSWVKTNTEMRIINSLLSTNSMIMIVNCMDPNLGSMLQADPPTREGCGIIHTNNTFYHWNVSISQIRSCAQVKSEVYYNVNSFRWGFPMFSLEKGWVSFLLPKWKKNPFIQT